MSGTSLFAGGMLFARLIAGSIGLAELTREADERAIL